jgi:hypothetical protein
MLGRRVCLAMMVLLWREFKLISDDFRDDSMLLWIEANDFTFKSSSTVLWKLKRTGPFYEAGSSNIFLYTSTFGPSFDFREEFIPK